MKKVKCILAVILGTVLGLLSACVSREKAGEPVKEQAGAEPRKKAQPQPPKKGEELPVRRPILE